MKEHDFADWLYGLMERRRLRQSQIAAYIGLSPSAVSKWLARSARPDPGSLEKLAELSGERLAVLYSLAGHPNPDYDPPPRQVLSPIERIVEATADLPIPIPIYDQLASAGDGQIAAMDTLWMPPAAVAGRRSKLFGLRVKGFSMEPDIKDGDTLIIDGDATPGDGDTVLASVGDHVYVKHLKRKSDHFILAGTNGVVIPFDDARIAGVVIQIVRDIPRGRRR